MGDAPKNERPITVLVTGFAPFQERFPVNPSYEIAKTLPNIIKPSNGRSRPIKIILYQPAIPVVYETVFALIPGLLSAHHGEIDAVLHIGMASLRPVYTVEKYANRDGYAQHPDCDGKDVQESFILENFSDCPTKMTTSLDYDRLLEDWWMHTAELQGDNAQLTRDHLRRSEDAGNYLCDYIYLNSLAFYARKNAAMTGGKVTDRPVLFYHVSSASDAESIAKGTVVATGLIKAMADQIAESIL